MRTMASEVCETMRTTAYEVCETMRTTAFEVCETMRTTTHERMARVGADELHSANKTFFRRA